MQRPEKVVAVVPTYDRVGGLETALNALRAQSRAPDRIIVIDNASPPAMRSFLGKQSGIEVKRLDRNAGAPGGFQAGLAAGLEEATDWIWLIDDDCVPAWDALESLLDGSVAAQGRAVAACAPTVVFSDGRREAGWSIGPRGRGRRQQVPRDPERGDGAVDWAPFAGLLMRAEAVRAAGALAPRLYLWHSDVEYCLRLRAQGWELRAVTAACVWHPARRLIGRRVLWRQVWVSDTPPWREYYDVRDGLALRRMLRDGPFANPWPWRAAAGELKSDLMLVLADRLGWRRVWMRVVGLYDGLQGAQHRFPERNARYRRSSEKAPRADPLATASLR